MRTGDHKQKRRSEQMDTGDDSDDEEGGHGGAKGDLKEFNYSETLSHHVSDSALSSAPKAG